MKLSKAKCKYVVDRIEELRNVKGGFITLTEKVRFVFDNPYINEHLYNEALTTLTMNEPVDALIEDILKQIDNKWLNLTFKK